MSEFWSSSLDKTDPAIANALGGELGRQQHEIELIASENIVSRAVLQAQGSVATNKYAEGYPGRRYYNGCEYVDEVEQLAIDRARELFGARFVNVQPHSGSQANQTVMMALSNPGETLLGLALDQGGHLTHGSKVNQSGKWFDAVAYGLRKQDQRIDYDAMEELADKVRPSVIIGGASAYARHWDMERMRAIADKIGAIFFFDMAHVAGLVAAGLHPSPLPHAHVVSTTTHKTLRAGRGGMVLTNDEAIAKKVNSALFPGLQGGPLIHAIAGKAVGLGEALQPRFKDYQAQVIANAKRLAEKLIDHGFDIVTGGTDIHLMLLDLRPKGLKGNEATDALSRAGITCNKNAVPFDDEKPTITSGLRLGTPAATTRGFGISEFEETADLINEVLEGLRQNGTDENKAVEAAVKRKVEELTARFPIYDRAYG